MRYIGMAYLSTIYSIGEIFGIIPKSLCSHELSVVCFRGCRCHCRRMLLLARCLITETSCLVTHAHMLLVYAHKIFSHMAYIFKMMAIFFSYLPLLPVWLITESSYLIQRCICIRPKHTKITGLLLPILWLIRHNCQRANTIMNCLLCLVIGIIVVGVVVCVCFSRPQV